MADIRVEDVMTMLVVTVQPDTSIHEAAQKLARNRISGAPVVTDGKVVGVISEADLVRASLPPAPVDRGLSILDMLSIVGRGRAMPRHRVIAADVMSSNVIQVPVGTSIWKAAELMDRRGVKRLPVVDDKEHLIGIVSRSDLVRALARTDDQVAIDVAYGIELLGAENFEDLEVLVDGGITTLHGRADRRTTRDIAVRIAARTPGVIEVIDRMEYSFDDSMIHDLRSQIDPMEPRRNWVRDEVMT